MCYHSRPEWTWERWQSKGTPHFLKLQNYWGLTIRLFSFISRTLIGGLLPLCRDAVSPSRVSQYHSVTLFSHTIWVDVVIRFWFLELKFLLKINILLYIVSSVSRWFWSISVTLFNPYYRKIYRIIILYGKLIFGHSICNSN